MIMVVLSEGSCISDSFLSIHWTELAHSRFHQLSDSTQGKGPDTYSVCSLELYPPTLLRNSVWSLSKPYFKDL